MITVLGESVVDEFRGIVSRRLGLQFDDVKLSFLEEVLQGRLLARGNTAQAYLEQLNTVAFQPDEWRALARELTVGETYFFRHSDQFHAFADVVLPDRLAARSPSRRLRILSAGCASGDEPYSLAMLVRERLGESAREVVIQGVDINPVVLEKAGQARYSSWSLRETPEEIQRRWFRNESRDFVLDETIRKAVRFEERNLLDPNPDLWQPDSYDVVFCRNMIMYFSSEASQALIARITQALRPGGYLFLGHAETLRGLSHDFLLLHTHGTFYYHRKETVDPADVMAPAAMTSPYSAVPDRAMDVGWATTWLETVQHASDRIHALAEKSPVSSRGSFEQTAEADRQSMGSEVGVVMELLKMERFSEALGLLDQFAPGSARDPDILLLRATLLAHSGQLAPAETACAQLLEMDTLNSGAHYLLALCREAGGDRPAAVDHDQMAAYLDPSFAMPRLHLGLMAQRAGDTDAAHRDLQQALQLLAREDASRLLLFGGGFGRDALMALCRAEIIAGGAKP